jgi:hypothetical protein
MPSRVELVCCCAVFTCPISLEVSIAFSMLFAAAGIIDRSEII